MILVTHLRQLTSDICKGTFMFQTYNVASSPQYGRERVAQLRSAMDALDIDGFLVPRADEFQGEYVPANAERLAWLTGFTGSAGVALVLADQAVIFVDGRYTTQLAEQVDGDVFTPGDLVGAPPHVYLESYKHRALKLGIDPWLHTIGEVRRLEKALEANGGQLVLLDHNPVDRLWKDRPAEPLGRVAIQPQEQAGTLAKDKIATIAEGLAKWKADAVLLADPSSVAWSFNIRGNDVPHTPHPLARALIFADGSGQLFLDAGKTGIEQKAYLTQLAELQLPEHILDAVRRLGSENKTIMVDPDIVPYALVRAMTEAGGTVVETADPARLPRAIKNSTEIQGSRQAHLQDGAAMVEFLAWLDSTSDVTEIGAAQKLEACRAAVGERMQNPLKDISFDTISGAGSNAAIIHYRVSTTTDRALESGTLFLVDSGAQYINGTTDITRTVAIGTVPEEQKRFFTLVLKGMIAISTARFPAGTRGVDLDPLARIALWKAGADYGHGTGHGVGSYLSVHEGPQRISRQSMQEILPGMILSNEPGYYRPGSFGIRIENLLHVTEEAMIANGDRPMRGFETLTWCPIDRRAILPELLDDEERQWLNVYHAQTFDNIAPLLADDSTWEWLRQATASI